MAFSFQMRPQYRDYIRTNIFRIGHKLGNHSLYCEVRHFSKPQVTWEKRKFLRKKLVQSLKQMVPLQNQLKSFPVIKSWGDVWRAEEEWDKLLVPGSRPTHCWSTVSIAHCPVMGGFIFSFNRSLNLGLDIEIAERIHEGVIRRLAQSEEIKKAPDKALLWTAKEASFKCLGVDKGVILPVSCSIFDWIRWDPAYMFSFSHKDQKGRGGGFRVANLAFAYAQLEKQG